MPNVNDNPDLIIVETATIANGQTTSDAIDCRGASLASYIIPAAMTSTSISFQVSLDGTNYFELKDAESNATISYNITVSTAYSVKPHVLCGFQYLKVVGASSEAGDREIKLGIRRFV